MISIIIIEGDYVWQSKIETILFNFKDFHILGFASTIEAAIKLIGLKKPDIIISDVFVNGKNVLDFLSSLFSKIPTVFISAYQHDASFNQILKFPLVSYIAKPFHDYTLLSALFQISKHIKESDDNFKFLNFRGLKSGSIKVFYSKITRIEVDGNYSICFTSDGKKFAKKISLSSLLKIIDGRFVRISKTIVVNTDYVVKVNYFDKLVYIENECFKIGRPYYGSLNSGVLDHSNLPKPAL